MVDDGCRWFKVVLGGFRSFHVLVTTAPADRSGMVEKMIFIQTTLLLNRPHPRLNDKK